MFQRVAAARADGGFGIRRLLIKARSIFDSDERNTPPMTLFIATFSTLLAIINSLEALPVFLELAGRKDDQERTRIARRSCLYAVALMFFF